MSETALPKLIIAVNPTPSLKEFGGWHSTTNRIDELIRTLSNTGVTIKIDSIPHQLDSSLIYLIKQNNLRYFADLRLNKQEALRLNLELVADYKPDIVSVLCSTGCEYMRRVKQALPNTKVFGVATLGDISDPECHEIYQSDAGIVVMRLVNLAIEANLDGVICSTKHIKDIRRKFDKGIIPLIATDVGDGNPEHKTSDFMSPEEAIEHGADCIIVSMPPCPNQQKIIKDLIKPIK